MTKPRVRKAKSAGRAMLEEYLDAGFPMHTHDFLEGLTPEEQDLAAAEFELAKGRLLRRLWYRKKSAAR